MWLRKIRHEKSCRLLFSEPRSLISLNSRGCRHMHGMHSIKAHKGRIRFNVRNVSAATWRSLSAAQGCLRRQQQPQMLFQQSLFRTASGRQQ